MGLERHLQDQRRAGTLESSGQFTLSRDAALEKLAHYGLADPELAPLKLAQTAMQLGCPELLLTHRAGHLEMIMPGANLDATRLGFENLTEISGNELLETFKLTLMSCLFGGFETIEVCYQDNQWTLDRQSHERRRLRKPVHDLSVRLYRQREAGFWARLKGLLRGRCLDHHLLYSRLFLAPIPIRLDGTSLKVRGFPRRCLLEIKLQGPANFFGESVREMDPRSYRRRLRHKQHEKGAARWETFLAIEQPAALKHFGGRRPGPRQSRSCLLAHLWVPLPLQLAGKIWYVADGVVVGEEQLPHPIGLNAVVSAAGLDTDLSGLKLVDNVKKERLRNYLERVLERALDQLLAIEPHPPKKLTRKLLAHLPERAARLAQLEKRHSPGKKPRQKKARPASTYSPTAPFHDDYKTVRRQQREQGF